MSVINQPCDEGVVLGAPSGSVCSGSLGRWILTVTILGSSLSFIDSTVVTVALPAIQHSLQGTLADTQWVIEAYSLMVASLLLIGGAAGDLFGRRRVYVTGVGIFAAGSAFCGLSGSIPELIAGRAVQGFGSALLVPGAMAIISASFAEHQRGRAIGIWSGFSAITSALGPVLGGLIVQHASWHWIFVINIPIALLVIGLALRWVPESRASNRGPLDLPGAVTASAGFAAITYALIESSIVGWTEPVIRWSLAGGLVCLAAFILVELHAPSPMLPLTLFRSRNFSGANLLTFFLYAAINSALLYFPFNLIQVQGYSAPAAGAAYLPIIVIMFLLSRWAGGLVHRSGPKLPLVTGPIVAAAGFALFAVPGIGGTYWTTFFPGFVVLALGMAVTVAPLTTTVMSALSRDKVGIASGINNAVSRVGALLAIAVYGIILVHVFGANLDRNLSTLDLPPEIRQSVDRQKIKLAGIEVPPNLPSGQVQPFKRAVAESFVSAFRTIMIVSAALSLLSALCAWLIIE